MVNWGFKAFQGGINAATGRGLTMAVENDLVLIHYEDTPLVFARIESITPDVKPDWYHITLLMLQVPVQTVTWILRDVYINGQEFTMDGKRMRLETIVAPAPESGQGETQDDAPPSEPTGKGKVISLQDIKR